MNKEAKKIIEICIIVICLIILMTLIVIGIYDRPTADDYDYAILTHNIIINKGNFFQLIKAAWATNINFYQTWQGLYSSAFLLSLQPGIYGEKLYAIGPIIIITLAFVCTYIGIAIINKYFVKRVGKLFNFAATLFIITFLFLWIPSPVQGIYWFNGAMNYTPWAFANFLTICILISAYKSEKTSKKVALIIIATIIAFLTSGGNHVTAFANILYLLILLIYYIHKNRKVYAIYPLISAIVGFIIMFLAPGTTVRQGNLEKATIIKTLFETFKKTIHIADEWITLVWILSILLITPVVIEIAKNNKTEKKVRFPWWPLVLSFIVIAGMLAVPYYAMSNFGVGRLTNVVWINFILLSWFNYFLIIRWVINNEMIKVKHINLGKYSKTIKVVCACMLMGLLVVLPQNGNESSVKKAARELSNGTAKRYANEIDERIKKYNDPNINIVEVREIENKSGLLFLGDIGTNPNVWPNTSISKYYNKTIYKVEQ